MALNAEPANPMERKEHHLPPKSFASAADEGLDKKKSPDPSENHAPINAEPADPTERKEQHLPPKSFASAADEGLGKKDFADHDTAVDEETIKESPPRNRHARKTSEPRPYGEVMDEISPPRSASGSPTLRHTKGRLEEQSSISSYADAVKEEDEDESGMLDGVGKDEEPRSPTRSPARKSHGRKSSNVVNRNASKQGHHVNGNAHAGELVYEDLTNRSGENLASIQPSEPYYTSIHQRANKQTTSEPSAKVDGGRTRQNSDLVSGRRAGDGWSNSKIRWAPWNVPLQRRLQTLLVLFHTLTIPAWTASFLLLCAIPLLWPILLPYLLYVLFSRASTSGTLSHRSEYLRSMRIWSLFASYFPARLHRSTPLEPTRKYIFGYHPHGIISHGAFAAFATEALGFSQLFPGITNTLLTLDSNFRVPLYRDYALRMGLASVSRESCENLLSKGGPNGEGMGRAITIVVGGARESLDAKPSTLRLVLRRRKGFVKLAIRSGADLVPTLAFGENDLYEQLDTEVHPGVHKMQMLVKKLFGFTVPLFHARGIFNYDVGLLPYRRPLNIVVGRPIEVQQARSPDPAYVDEIHEKYINELLRIWEDWKDVFARTRGGELEIVE